MRIITLLLLANLAFMAILTYKQFFADEIELPETASRAMRSLTQLVKGSDGDDFGINNSPVFATVNGINIHESEVIRSLNQIAPREQLAKWGNLVSVPSDVLSNAIDNAALNKLLSQRAEESKLHLKDEVVAILSQQRDEVLKKALLDSIRPTLVAEDEVKQQYQNLAASLQGKIEYRARHILLGNQEEAKVIKQALVKQKRPFADLAKLFSLDQASAARGGDLGYVLPGKLNADFEMQVNQLKIGQTSEPFETELGWHIAIVEDRRESQAMTFEQAQPIIRQRLEAQAIQTYLQEILSSAEVKIQYN